MLKLLARQAVETLPSLGELGILVPLRPVLFAVPRPHYDTVIGLVLLVEKLPSDPPRLLPRRGEPLAHHGIPLRLRTFLESNGGDDGHHGDRKSTRLNSSHV